MSERERWIVYPLLFLALGAALRDKLINSTESQRIKCQGLMVYDSSGQVSMVLGAEQFPDVQQPARNMLSVDQLDVVGRIDAGRLDAKNLTAGNLKADNLTAGNLKAGNLISENLSMGKLVHVDMAQGVTLSISGPNVIRLLAWLDQFQRYVTGVANAVQQRAQQAAAQEAAGNATPPPDAAVAPPESTTPDSTATPTTPPATPANPPVNPSSEPPVGSNE
jgi:hypothetical protein